METGASPLATATGTEPVPVLMCSHARASGLPRKPPRRRLNRRGHDARPPGRALPRARFWAGARLGVFAVGVFAPGTLPGFGAHPRARVPRRIAATLVAEEAGLALHLLQPQLVALEPRDVLRVDEAEGGARAHVQREVRLQVPSPRLRVPPLPPRKKK
eukprot:6042418-Pyramimonas_sp.AAC.1